MRPPKTLGGDLLKCKDFVQIGKEKSSIPLSEWGTEDSGNEIKCYVAASPGDIISVNYDLQSGSADFVDIFVDGVLRFSSLNHSCFSRQRGQATKFCHCERRDNGVKRKLQVYQLEVCSLNVDEYTIEPSPANSTSDQSQSPVVGTIELRVLKEIPENGTQKQALRGPTFEDHENCLSINPSIKSDKLPPTYQLGFSKPENTKSKLRKYINESIEGYYVWASFTFMYRSSQALRAAGFKVPLETGASPSSISSTSTSTPPSTNPSTPNTNEDTLTSTGDKSSLDIIMERFEAKDASNTKTNFGEVVAIVNHDDSDATQLLKSPLATFRDGLIPDLKMSDNQVTMLVNDGESLLYHTLDFIGNGKGKVKSEVTKSKDPQGFEILTTSSESSVETKDRTNQVSLFQAAIASQNSIAVASTSSAENQVLGTETRDPKLVQDKITISNADGSFASKNVSIDSQTHMESSFATQSQNSVTAMEIYQTPEPYTGSLKGLGIMPDARNILNSHATVDESESINSTETSFEDYGNAQSAFFGNGSRTPHGQKIETHIVHHGRGVITAEPVNEKSKTKAEYALQHLGRGVVVSQEPVTDKMSSSTDVHTQDPNSNEVQELGLTHFESAKQISSKFSNENFKIMDEVSSLIDKREESTSVSQPFETTVQSTILEDITMEDAKFPLSAKRKTTDLFGGCESGLSFVDNEHPAKRARQSGAQKTSLITPDAEEVQKTSEAWKLKTSIQGLVSQGLSGIDPEQSGVDVKMENAGKVDILTGKGPGKNSSIVEKPKIDKRKKLPTEKETREGPDSANKTNSASKTNSAAKKKQVIGAGVKTPSKTPVKGPAKQAAKGKTKVDTQDQGSSLLVTTSVEERCRKLQEMKAAVKRVKAERERLLREVQEEEAEIEAEVEAETRTLEEEFERVQQEIDELNAHRRSINHR